MSKHTPPPWHVEHETEIIAGDGDQRVAWIDDRSVKLVGGEAVANAHLVAAAPDLLAALIKCEAYLDEFYDPDESTYAGDKLLREVRAAIAKSEGEAMTAARRRKRAKRKTTHRCGGCGKTFRTPQGLGLHFTWQRKKHGIGCGEVTYG